MDQYLPVLALVVLAGLFGGISRVASHLLAPRKPTAAKEAPYECGIVPGREAPERFPVKFYLVAMLFIMFDIEIIFLYPYAVLHRELGWFGLAAMLFFSAVFFLSFVYELAKGGLDWGPVKRVVPALGAVSSGRTAATTVRRVGLEGREAGEPGVAA
ncbi:MAG: NADH-quinone oxidoreductase subunit A [Acidimicrobiales bacterium]|nr:NADH-quinone oxidoreductase subunit A [Acidimicrobiales bacterium]